MRRTPRPGGTSYVFGIFGELGAACFRITHIVEMSGYPLDKLDSKVQSRSLFPIIDGSDTKNRDAFIETGGLYGPWPSPKKHNVFAVRSNDKKLIYNDTPETWEFYNLLDDPMEQNNLYDKNLDDVQELKTKLYVFMKENNIETKLNSLYT